MKNLYLAVAAAFAFSHVKAMEPKQLTGIIGDAGMNTVVVKSFNGDSVYTFSTTGADMAGANGMLLGNLITVDYTGDLTGGGVIPAVKVVTDSTYAQAVGKWTMPDPINAESVMGIEIMVNGKASSINMATLVYDAWELSGTPGEIVLHGQSIGNGQTVGFDERAVIVKRDGKLYLALKDGNIAYQKQDM